MTERFQNKWFNYQDSRLDWRNDFYKDKCLSESKILFRQAFIFAIDFTSVPVRAARLEYFADGRARCLVNR